MNIDILKDRLGLREVPTERDFHTMAGLILWQLERVPATGEHIDYGGYRFEVVDMDGRKIDKVLAAPLTQPCNESQEPAGR